MRILITGCGGMLGEAVFPELNGRHTVYATDIDVNADWLHHLDVRSQSEMDKFARTIDPDVVIHLAALTDLEYCEVSPGHAYETNFIGTHNAARVAAQHRATLVYVTSAGVFDGNKEVYDEFDSPNPVNVYAKTKYSGELAAMAYPKTIMVRAGWMIGGGPGKDKKFVNKIVKQLREGSRELHVVRDKLGTPTYTRELARTIHGLLEEDKFGVFHGACDGGGSRVDVAKKIVQHFGLEDEVKINVVGSEHFSKEYFVRRPRSEKLVSYKLPLAPPWQECLDDYLGRYEWKI
jgi:dTDP-4-dehydrorhamnose reductase